MKIRTLVTSTVIAGILNSLSMLIRFELGILIGLLTGLLALELLYHSQTGWSKMPLLIFAIGVTLVMWVSFTFICRVNPTNTCQMNIFQVSLFPGFIIMLCLILLSLRS